MKDIENVALFLGGLVYELIEKDIGGDIKNCLDETVDIGEEIGQAINDFEKFTPASVKDGVMETGKIITKLPSAIKDCEAIAQDAKRISQWASKFSSPWTLAAVVGKNVIENWHAIYDQVIQFSKDLHASNWFALGKDTGDLVISALGKITLMNLEAMPMTESDLLQNLAIQSMHAPIRGGHWMTPEETRMYHMFNDAKKVSIDNLLQTSVNILL